MKIKVSDFTELIENEKYAMKSVAIKEKDFAKEIPETLIKASEFAEESLNSGMLFEYQINGGNTIFLIQSGIINLPFQDSKKVRHFFDEEDEVETKLYLVTKSENINKSKLRIEKLSDSSELSPEVITKAEEIMNNQLATIEENIKIAKDEESEEK